MYEAKSRYTFSASLNVCSRGYFYYTHFISYRKLIYPNLDKPKEIYSMVILPLVSRNIKEINVISFIRNMVIQLLYSFPMSVVAIQITVMVYRAHVRLVHKGHREERGMEGSRTGYVFINGDSQHNFVGLRAAFRTLLHIDVNRNIH